MHMELLPAGEETAETIPESAVYACEHGDTAAMAARLEKAESKLLQGRCPPGGAVNSQARESFRVEAPAPEESGGGGGGPSLRMTVNAVDGRSALKEPMQTYRAWDGGADGRDMMASTGVMNG